MDNEELLDLLGNDNRRKILQLLSMRPCYVSEIVERLDVGPKAVLEHLSKLEHAGIIEPYTDDQRRKYFQIADELHMEIMLSPYLFEFNSIMLELNDQEFPRRYRDIFDSAMKNFNEVFEYFSAGSEESLKDLREEFFQLRALNRDLSMAQRFTHERLTEITEKSVKAIGKITNDYLEAEILMLLFKEENAFVEKIARQVNVPREEVADQLETMKKKGIVINKIDDEKEIWSINLE